MFQKAKDKEKRDVKAKSASTVAQAVPKPIMQASQAQHLVNVHKALATMRNCPIFQDVASMPPLPFDDGGSEHPYVHKNCVMVLKGGRAFMSAGNFMWIDHTWLCNHRVPLNRGNIKYLMKTVFKHDDPPKTSPYRAVIGLSLDQNASHGGLQRLSPEEIDHSILFAIELAIEQNVGDGILRAWLAFIRSYPMQFELIDEGDDRMWRAQNVREELVDIGEVVKRTVIDRVQDVAGLKREKEMETGQSMSSEKMAKLYQTKMKYARSTEKVSEAFVDSAITIDKRVLSCPVNQKLLEWCDETFVGVGKQHPFTSVYALQALCDRLVANAKPPPLSLSLDIFLVCHIILIMTTVDFLFAKIC